MTGPVPQTPAPRAPEPVSSVPSTGEPPAEKKGRDRARTRRLRLWIAMVAGVLTLLCLGGVGVAVLLYDEETKIERTAPDAVVDNFLLAYLVNRDDKAAKHYTCDSPNLAGIEALRRQLIEREKEFDVRVSISWGALIRTPMPENQEDVGTQLTISGSSNGQLTSSHNEDWHFRAVDNGGGWRVCDASKVA